jgi:hypothetical protein
MDCMATSINLGFPPIHRRSYKVYTITAVCIIKDPLVLGDYKYNTRSKVVVYNWLIWFVALQEIRRWKILWWADVAQG